MPSTTIAEHRDRVERLAAALRSSTGRRAPAQAHQQPVPSPAATQTGCVLDGTTLDHVIAIDRVARTAEVEGMTTYADLVDATLPHGLAPAVVPELKSITVGGATTGLGIESSSFRYGLVHETVDEFDVLVADGRVLRCSPTEHADLFLRFPELLRQPRLCDATHRQAHPGRAVRAPAPRALRGRQGGTSPRSPRSARIRPATISTESSSATGDFVLTRATMVEQLPGDTAASDYTWMRQYWRSLRGRTDDYLTIGDYLWRWDTDWFWCSRNVGAQLAPVRMLAGPAAPLERHLPEDHARRPALPAEGARAPASARGIGDPGRGHSARRRRELPGAVPRPRSASRRSGSARSGSRRDRYPLYRLRTDTPYVNFGFWDTVRSRHPDGHYNAIVEQLVAQHGGKKSLYSRSTFDEQAFWSLYDRRAYDALKREYDPAGRFPGLYEKTVGRG